MKRLLSVALMVLVTLVGMVGFSRAQTLGAISTASGRNVFPPYPNKEEDEIARTEALARANAVSVLQATANPTTGAVNELLDYDLDTVYDWETVYALEKVYARVPAKAKMYYPTVFGFTGGDAITACDSGFHMASISEIQDPSSLQYADRSTAAYDSLVDGQRLGPPSNHMGWVRTAGYPLTGFQDNCNFWQSSSDQEKGTTMSLDPILGDANPELHDPMWWHKVQQMCSLEEPVWCVEDPDEHSATKTSKSTQ